jgi:aldose 1-epimerase
MSFSIKPTIENGIHLIQLQHEKNNTTVSIAPDYGAMLHSFEVATGQGQYNIISNYSSAAEIDKTLGSSYKSSKLSPFPCRIKNGQYTLQGRLYEFEKKFLDGSAIHGLLFNKKFQRTEQTVNDLMASVSFQYDYKAEDLGYPFHYTCIIRYTLFADNTLQLQTMVINKDHQVIPLADGWHPYFQLQAPVDDCTLQFETSGMLEFDEHLIPTGKVLPFNGFDNGALIAAQSLDNCFLLPENALQPVCVLRNKAANISLHFTADENYPYLQIYTPPNRQSIAIENLSAAPDSFNNKMGLLLLEPGSQKTLTLHYQVKTGETA